MNAHKRCGEINAKWASTTHWQHGIMNIQYLSNGIANITLQHSLFSRYPCKRNIYKAHYTENEREIAIESDDKSIDLWFSKKQPGGVYRLTSTDCSSIFNANDVGTLSITIN